MCTSETLEERLTSQQQSTLCAATHTHVTMWSSTTSTWSTLADSQWLQLVPMQRPFSEACKCQLLASSENQQLAEHALLCLILLDFVGEWREFFCVCWEVLPIVGWWRVFSQIGNLGNLLFKVLKGPHFSEYLDTPNKIKISLFLYFVEERNCKCSISWDYSNVPNHRNNRIRCYTRIGNPYSLVHGIFFFEGKLRWCVWLFKIYI